jgi:hypothetical protein
MAITIEGQPQPLTPSYNPVWVFADSTNKNEVGFRYVLDVFDAVTNTKLFEQRIAPRPNDGFMDVNISKPVSTYVDKTIPFNTTALINAAGSWRQLNVEIGEEYSVSWTFNFYQANNTFSGGNVEISGATNHGFSVGDQIRITLNVTYNDNRDQLNGLFTVIGVVDSDTLVISATEIIFNILGTISGKMRYADNRRTIFRDLEDFSFTIFNGALPLKEFKDWDWDEWNTDQVAYGKFLTSMPREYKVKPDSDVWLNMFGDGDAFMNRLRMENSNGDVFNANLTDSSFVVGQVAAGLGNHPTMTALTGSLPVVKDDTTFVDVWLADSSGARVTEVIRYTIDRRCTIEDYDILFMDRKGSFVPFAFQLRTMEKGTIRREQYNKKYGRLDTVADEGTFDLYDAGMTTYHVDTEKTLELNTNYMDDAMSVYFEELLTSPYTFLKVGTDYYSVSVTETGFDTVRQKNKRLIRKTVNVKFDINTPVNI